MRIDLGLQRVELCPAPGLVFCDDILHQSADAVRHLLHRGPQVTDLLRSPDVDLSLKVSAFDDVHGVLQLPDRRGDPGRNIGVDQGQDVRQQADDESHKQKILLVVQVESPVGGDPRQLPSRVSHGLYGDMAVLSLVSLGIGPVPGGRSGQL